MRAAEGARADDEGGVVAPVAPRPRWLRDHVVLLVTLDTLSGAAATVAARTWQFGPEPAHLSIRSVTVPYLWLAVVLVPMWLGVLAVSGAYDVGPFGTTLADHRRVVRAGASFLAVVAVAYFVLHIEQLARGFLATTVPLAVGLTLLGRLAAQYHLDQRRRRGDAVRHALVVGSRASVAAVVRHLARFPGSGLAVTGACVPDANARAVGHGDRAVPVVGTPDTVLEALQRTGADALVLTGDLPTGGLRQLTWRLQGSGVDVFVTPTPALGAARHDVRPVAGLPLVYVFNRLR